MKPCITIQFGWLLIWLAAPMVALAYRPFVSTDAAVTEKGVSEVELGVVDLTNHRGQNTVASPSVRYNFGFAEGWEIVAEGALQVFDSASHRNLQILEPELSIKNVLLDGPLQDAPSPISIAFEMSVLPETTTNSGWGFESVLIASWRTGDFTWHLNGGGGWRRESQEPVMLWGVIVERPIVGDLRVAAEINGESGRGFTADNSALIGLLWDHRRVTYDAGLRFGLSKAAADVAFTAGLTFRF